MADSLLPARSPLAGLWRQGRFGRPDGPAGVTLAEITGRSLVAVAALRGQSPAVIAALAQAFGITPPSAPRRVKGARVALSWTGPGQWLASAEAASGDLAAELTHLLTGAAAVTDHGDAWLTLTLTGPRVPDILAKCLPIDLDPRVFKPGDVALTRAGHIDLRCWHDQEPGVYEIACSRSYAGSLFSWLEESALEFGLVLASPSSRS